MFVVPPRHVFYVGTQKRKARRRETRHCHQVGGFLFAAINGTYIVEFRTAASESLPGADALWTSRAGRGDIIPGAGMASTRCRLTTSAPGRGPT
jgi:hypothetical protein